MSRHTVAWKASTKQVQVLFYGDAIPSGYVDIGNYYHNGGGTDSIGPTKDSHRLFHHVQDLLYKQGEQNMQAVQINFKYLTGISVSPPTATKAVNATQQLTVTFAPTDASNRTVTYKSSDTSKATVDANGLVTAVASGTATITVTSEEGGWTASMVLTIS